MSLAKWQDQAQADQQGEALRYLSTWFGDVELFKGSKRQEESGHPNGDCDGAATGTVRYLQLDCTDVCRKLNLQLAERHLGKIVEDMEKRHASRAQHEPSLRSGDPEGRSVKTL